jgi:hypothetical protein
MKMTRTILLLMILATVLTACDALPFNIGPTPLPNTLVYEAPVTFVIKKDSMLGGTTLAYSGKNEAGSARLMIAGQVAPKQVGDSVDWKGSPAPNISVNLSARVITYDDQVLTLGGVARLEIKNFVVQPGGTSGTALIEFSAPVTFNLSKGEIVPGSNLSYVGATPNGAQFAGVEGYPYRKTLDSITYTGRLAPKVFLRHDLRLVRFTDTDAVVGGTAKIIVEQ